MRTLNQLAKVFEDFANQHGQVNSFGIGDLWEVGMSQQLQYPLVWIQPTQTRALKGQSGFSRLNTTFNVFIVDRVKKDESNETEVLSDTTLIACDLIKRIDTDPTILNANYTFNTDNVVMEYVTEKLKDEVSGVFLSLSFEYPFAYGCSRPDNV